MENNLNLPKKTFKMFIFIILEEIKEQGIKQAKQSKRPDHNLENKIYC